MLILPGSELWADAITDPALAKAQNFVDSGVPIAAICGATFGLARVGLLDDRRHTSNDPNWLASSGYRGMANYVQEHTVEDGGIITASVTASLEFAKLILGRLGVFSLNTKGTVLYLTCEFFHNKRFLAKSELISCLSSNKNY